MKIGMAYFEFGGTKGTARAVTELCLRLARKGHEVDVHCTQWSVSSPHRRICFHRVRALNSFNAIGIASFALNAGRSLKRQVYDVTHSHGNIIGADVITAHSCHRAALEIAQQYAGPIRSRNFGVADAFRLYLEKKNYAERRFKKVIAVSRGVKRELMETYGLHHSDICIIPNGVDIERFHPSLRKSVGAVTRMRLGIRTDDFVIIVVANEFTRKGLVHCIDALAKLERSLLLVAGNDRPEAYRTYAQKMGVAERVLFCGAVPAIEQYYAAADVFLLPTFYEAFSLATLEAAASGLPLVVTKVNGTEELIEDGRNGFFIERDGDEIAHRLRQLRDDQRLRTMLGEAARQSALRYAWDSIADQTLRVYEEVR